MLDKAIKINDKVSQFLHKREWDTKSLGWEFEKAQREIKQLQISAIKNQIYNLLRLREEAEVWATNEVVRYGLGDDQATKTTKRERQKAAVEQRKIEKAIQDLNNLLPLEDRMVFTHGGQVYQG